MDRGRGERWSDRGSGFHKHPVQEGQDHYTVCLGCFNTTRCVQVDFGGDSDTRHKIGGKGVKSKGPMKFSAGEAEFTGPLEMEGDASLECGVGVKMSLKGGAKHKISGKGMDLFGDLALGFGEISFDAPLNMQGDDCFLEIESESLV